MAINAQGIAWIATYQCNLACPHCFFSTNRRGHYVTPKMVERALRSLDEPMEWMHITGGEPLMDVEAFLALVSALRHHHPNDIGIATNAYWATDESMARSMVERMHQAGVTGVCLSVDVFHQAGVPLENVIHAAEAVVDSGMTGHSHLVTCMVPGDDESNQRSLELARRVAEASGMSIAETDVRPIGRGRMLTNGNNGKKLPEGPCQDLACCLGENGPFEPQMVWLDPFGHVMICYGLTIGSLIEHELADVLNAYRPGANPITRVLGTEGPRGLYDMADRHVATPEGPFHDECDLCFRCRTALRPLHPEHLSPVECYPDR